MVLYNTLPALSLWDGLLDFFEMVGSFFTMIWNFIDQAITGIVLAYQYIGDALPLTTMIIGQMPVIIVAAATITLLIFVLRFVFGAFVG